MSAVDGDQNNSKGGLHFESVRRFQGQQAPVVVLVEVDLKNDERLLDMLAFFLAPATFWVLITGVIADEFGTYVVAFEVWAVSFLLAGIVSSLVTLPNRDEALD